MADEFDEYLRGRDSASKPAKDEFESYLNERSDTDENAKADVPVNINNPEVVNKTSVLDAMVSGSGQGASLTLGDEAVGVVGGVKDKIQALRGERGDIDFMDAYRTNRDAARKHDDQGLKEHPGVYRGSEFVGGGMLGGAAGVAAKGTGTVAKVAKVLAPDVKFDSFLKDLGKLAKSGAATGAVTGFGSSKADVTKGEVVDAAKDTTKGAAIGVGTSPLAWLLGKSVDKTLKSGAQKTSSTLGRGKDISEPYIQNPGKYNDPDVNFPNAKGQFDKAKAGLSDPIADAQQQVDAAYTNVEKLRGSLKESYGEESVNAREALRDAKAAHQRAADQLRDVEREATRDTKDKIAGATQQARNEYQDRLATRSKPELPTDLTDRVSAALVSQRKGVGKLAGEQMEMLKGDTKKYPLSEIDSVFGQALDREKINGVLPDNDNVSGITSLQKLIDGFKAKGSTKTATEYDPTSFGFKTKTTETAPGQLELTPEDMVKLRQNVDDHIAGSYDRNTGAYNERSERVGRDVRGLINKNLDTQLPNSKEYAGLRGQLSQETRLASDASKAFGGRNQLATLYALQNPSNAQKAALLKQLSAKHDPEITQALERFWAESAAAKSPAAKRDLWKQVMADLADPATGEKIDMGALQSKLRAPSKVDADLAARPETRALADAQDAVLPYESKYLRGAIDNEVAESPAQLAANEATGALQGANDKAAPVKKYLKGDSEDLIRSLMNSSAKKPNIEEQEAAKYIGQQAGVDLGDVAHTLKVKTAFEGGGPNGSRMVNLGGGIGSLAGPVGRAAGKVAGAVTDYSTGALAKGALDAYIATRGPNAATWASATRTAIDALVSHGAEGKKYLDALDAASQRGPEALAVTHAMLMKDPGYANMLKSGPQP